MGKHAPAAPARWRLRVQAEGAQGIKAASGIMGSMDAKPDPYVIFEFNGATKKCAPVQDVEPVQYFAWPDAVVEFDVHDEALLQRAALVVHVKDSDTLKDRYIGGTSIALAPLLAQASPGELCRSRFFALKFEDEKLKKKKPCGEVKLTMTVIDTMKKPEPAAAPAVAEATAKSAAGPVEDNAKAEPVKAAAPPPEKAPAAVATEEEKLPATVELPSKSEPPAKPEQASISPSEPPKATDPAKMEASSAAVPPKDTLDASRRSSQPLSVEAAIEKAAENDTPAIREGSAQSTPMLTPVNIKTLRIELVSGRELTRPTSIGALFDRKPDPLVTLEFYGLSKSSIAIKDVDLKKPVEWTNTILAFDLPNTAPPSKMPKGRRPLDLVVHVKDENLMKATYMGGGKMDLSEFFEARSEETGWCWRSTPSFVAMPQERTVMLTHSDEKLSKKKACGELTVRFHFDAEPVAPPADEPPSIMETNSNEAKEPTEPSSTDAAGAGVRNESSPPTASQSRAEDSIVQNEDKVPAIPVITQDAKPAINGDVKMLSVELLSGRGLSKPKVGNLAKSMMKSLFDRKPDPYAVMVLGTQTRKCPALKDVDVSFFEWKNSAQVFEFQSKPYPDTLIIHIRDEDIAGSDPFMGGARISMEDIWKEALNRATSDPPGDPQLVATYPLTFADEKMTKQKDCGSVTIRFRWIYAEAELPLVELPVTVVVPSASMTDDKELLQPVPPLKPRTGFVFLRKMALYNNTELLDSSLDLYVEASSSSVHEPQTVKKDSADAHSYTAKSSVLTDAMKGKGNSPGAKVEWIGDELIVPICLPLDRESADLSEIRIELKDKNAIMKDSEIAVKDVQLKDHAVDFTNFQPVAVTLELSPVGHHRKSAKTTLKFEAEVQFLPHDSPLLAATSPEQHGGMVTFFLMRSVISAAASSAAKGSELDNCSLAVEITCQATKKTGLMSFGKSSAPDYHSLSLKPSGMYENACSMISWWSTCSFPVSNKQAITAKEKEAFAIEVGVRMRAGKADKLVGSIQLNAYSAAFTPSPVVQIETIQFGALGSMTLEFAAAFRTITDESIKAASKTSQKPVAPPVPSGYLHIIILHAKNLVSPDGKAEKAEDLDPEVRISIEPKYIKRKENPVRSMLKTKPLENAGATPTWNEYLRLEYLLPPAPPPHLQTGNMDQRRASDAEANPKYPPPVVQIGVFDIQMPGEKGPVQAIGKTELPLSAFLLGAGLPGESPGNIPSEPVQLSLDIFLAEKKTGILVVEGIFEPAPAEFKAPADDPVEVYRQQCRSIGRDVRERSKKLKSGELNATTASLLTGSSRKRAVAGRLEVHIVGYRGGQNILSGEDRGLSAHVWISSSVDDRREMKSRMRASQDLEGECQVVWDAQLTLFTSDIAAEMLRCDILTLTGKPVGSLKLPLGGLLEQGGVGRTERAWHALAGSPSSGKKPPAKSKEPVEPTQEVLLELTFFADQVVFDPLSISGDVTTDSSTTIVIDCRKVIVLDAVTLEMAEVACKCSLLGSASSATANSKSQPAVERTSFKACDSVAGMDGNALAVSSWSEKVKLDVEGSINGFITQSFANGTQPALRLELLTKRQGARFQDTWASLTLSLVTLLNFPGRKVTRWLKFFPDGDKDGKDVRLSAILELEIAVFCSTSTIFSALKEEKLLRQAFEDMPQLTAVPGVLCLRFLSGRNLIDVDANGEQDPYIIARIVPRSFSVDSMQSACQTGVSLDGGRHPTWNTSIFELRTQDLLTDYVRLEVIDSNEEDHLPDAYIGAIDIALMSLFREHVGGSKDETDGVWRLPKTRWLEAWIPIYPVTPNGDEDGNAGEIRMDFRFLTEEYYESGRRQQTAVTNGSSPFSSTDTVANPARGTLCLHIAQAFGLACTTGMQPGVRISMDHTNRAFVTKPGKRSIMDPVWDREVVELPWPPEGAQQTDGDRWAKILKVEVVDLAVRSANANAHAVIAFGQVDFSSFLSHALARSYHIYPLHGRKAPAKGEQSPSILIGCQFVPAGMEKEASTALQQPEKRQEKRNGSLHLKCTQVRLDVSSYLSSMPLGAPLAIRLRCRASKIANTSDESKCIEVPVVSLADLVQKNGFVDIGEEASSLLFQYAEGAVSTESEITANPIILGELLAREKNKDAVVVAEFEVPIFDYVLFDGHLGSAWYKLLAADPACSSSPQVGEVRLEIQFLPVLHTPTTTVKPDAGEEQAGIAFLGVAIKQVTGWTASMCCTVAVELFGCSAETKPNRPTGTHKPPAELCWGEVLDIAVPKTDIKAGLTSGILKLKIRDAADATTVYGMCNWVVPPDLFARDGSLAMDSDEIAVPIELPAGLSKTATTKANASPPLLTFQLTRTTHENVNGGSGASIPVRRRRGLFYIAITDDSGPRRMKAAIVPTKGIDKLTLNSDVGWVELSTSERKVVPVYPDTAVDNHSLVVCSVDPAKPDEMFAVGTLGGQVISSVAKTPTSETFHRLPLRLLKDGGTAPSSQLNCRLMYLEVVQGQLQLQFDSVTWPASKSSNGKAPGTFQLEARLLSGISQRWVRSPLGFWSRKTNAISWPNRRNEIALGYTNADEQAEPSIQLVLVQLNDNGQPKKEAFGQIAVLSAITSTDGAWTAGAIDLSLIDVGPTKEAVSLSLQLRFVREEFSFEELEKKLAAERAKKALELAEGTATLKKAFAVMGGDEQKSIAIVDFKRHVKEAAEARSGADSDRSAMRALEVLQHAADVETNGDLDELFDLMDVNGDGQISWDEYVDHMQNIHALADAAATQAIQQQAEAARPSLTDTGINDIPEPENSDDGNTQDKSTHGTEHDEDQGDDSDLDDDRDIDMPTRPMRSGSDTVAIQDVYKVTAPAGENTREDRALSKRMSVERARQSKPSNVLEKLPDPVTETKTTARERTRSSIQPSRGDPKTESRAHEPQQVPKKKLPLLSTYVLDWKVDEVIQWMEHEMELSQYTPAIQQNAVNGKLLLTLREDELESELGVTAVLHKRKIMNQIREFQERFQYPPPDAVSTEARKRPATAKRVAPVVTASMTTETPSFIKREQLVFQEKQRAKLAEFENAYLPRTLGQSRVFPSKTKLLEESDSSTRSAAPAGTRPTNVTPNNNRKPEVQESFDDAMQDIFEVMHPDSPEKLPATSMAATTQPSSRTQALPRLPLIQIGSITNTDELFEIVRQRIHQLSQLLLPMANECKESWSDFGDDPDDDEGDQNEPPSEEQTGLHLVYDAFRNSRPSASTARISRLKFQEGLADLLSIEVSWHQFDLLFRQLDVDGDSELCWDEFHHVFTRQHISFEREDLFILQEALVDFAMARLESQQWTLSDLFKAFDRDGGGSVSIAEFATLVRFLFTSSLQVKRFQQQTKHKINKRHVYLLMSCLDASADRRISHQEFLRFFFIVWSSKLMQVQDELLALEASSSVPEQDDAERISSLRHAKRTLRRALRTNFSRPFRDAMRCLDVTVPGPFSGLLARLQLTASNGDTLLFDTETPAPAHRQEAQPTASQDGSRQVWQVLRGHAEPRATLAGDRLPSRERAAREASRQRVQKGRNEVQRTRLTRQREPSRGDATVLRTPARHVALDRDATLKCDLRPLL